MCATDLLDIPHQYCSSNNDYLFSPHCTSLCRPVAPAFVWRNLVPFECWRACRWTLTPLLWRGRRHLFPSLPACIQGRLCPCAFYFPLTCLPFCLAGGDCQTAERDLRPSHPLPLSRGKTSETRGERKKKSRLSVWVKTEVMVVVCVEFVGWVCVVGGGELVVVVGWEGGKTGPIARMEVCGGLWRTTDSS